jgi:hypothetical protein
VLRAAAIHTFATRHDAERILPKMRDWMTAHPWIINEIVILVFVVTVAKDL